MNYSNKTQRIEELQKRIDEAPEKHCGIQNMEDVDEVYQNILELGWYRDEIRGEIKMIENMTDEEFDEMYNVNVYSIYHPLGGSMNYECKPATYMYELKFTLKAKSLEEAFKLSQNDFNEEYAEAGIRSTSVGDIIQSQQDYISCECFLVKGLGFQTVPSTWLGFIDWGALMPASETMVSSTKEDEALLNWQLRGHDDNPFD